MLPNRTEIAFSFSRSGGPGGQNVNKVSSKVLLRWRPAASKSLPENVKSRLLAMLHGRLTNEGELLITSQQFRDQARNIDVCLEKLGTLIDQAARPPKKRKTTRPTRASREERLAIKKRRGERKAGRRRPADSD